MASAAPSPRAGDADDAPPLTAADLKFIVNVSAMEGRFYKVLPTPYSLVLPTPTPTP